ncbi:MAG: glycoside hydrolase family 3 C-terminal domain-containing protein, partial [Lachnospiraceae bacterium]|nr:glycoside hydrolase family 3 C-terminal domain-containing protein [Lachnospiraceae bacterium]
ELVDQMTIEEMASQLRFDAPEIEHLNIPAYNWWNEGLHGVARAGTATVFPQAIGLGATFDPGLLGEIGTAVGLEARAKYNESKKQEDRDIYKGITIWSPNVNLFRDPRWGRGQETYGEDPELISRLAVEFIRGLQGRLLAKGKEAPDREDDEFLSEAERDGAKAAEEGYLLVSACAKHFAVHSGPEAIRHEFDAKASMKDLFETYLPAFEASVREADVESVMGAYNRTNGDPCCAHPYLMEEVLRGKWGFKGHYVSDCWAIRDFHENHKITKSSEDSARTALMSGCDLNCGCTYRDIMSAYREWKLPEEYIRESAVRLFTTRFLLGMFDETPYDAIPYEIVDSPAHRKIAERAVFESVVLLKNNGILPLMKDGNEPVLPDGTVIRRIGVIGPNADDPGVLVGNYHGTPSRGVTVVEGLEERLGDKVRLFYAKGCHKFLDREEPLAQKDDRIAEALTVAEHSDLVILCVGLDETLEGEEGDTGNAYASGDKEDLLLPLSQRRLMQAVFSVGKPVTVLNFTGSAIDLTNSDERAAAVLQCWYPGGRGGEAIAKILMGDAAPSGKLPVTFYRNEDPLPEFTDYSMKGRTYRYLENEPLYPFGYGLTYGAAEAEDLQVFKKEEGTAVAKIRVKNAGSCPVSDVLQVYVKVKGTELECRNPKLAAFQRIHMLPGSEETVEIVIPERAFTVINEDGIRMHEGSGAEIFAGFGQPDARTEELTGHAALRADLP